MGFKQWFEDVTVTSLDLVQMKPSDLNAEFGRSDIRSKYVASSGENWNDPTILKKKPEEQFGFSRKDRKNLPKSINTNRKIVPMRTTQIYT